MSEAANQQAALELEGLVGTTLAERYRIDALLGVGGMGAVFRAHHLLLKRDVAVKVLHPKLSENEDVSKRFDREAQSAARLDHPNIIPVTEFGSTDEGMKYMVMQLLSGRELGELMGRRLEPMRAIGLILQVLRGLEHAHQNGVIHRDLKPENVFVTEDHDGEETLKLVDFGIAKIIDEEDPEASQPLTRMGLVFGTPHYMSPEQATGSEVDHRTDIYSTGVLLYQMLAGRVPFDHDDPVSLIRMQVSVDPPPLPEDVPKPLARVVKMMMAKARDKRYPDARSARKALQSVQARMAEDSGVVIPHHPQDTGVIDPRDIYGPEGVPQDGPGPSSSAPGSMAPTVPPGSMAPTVPPGQGLAPTGQDTMSPSSPTMAPVAPTPTTSIPTDKPSPFAAVPRKWLYVGGGVLALLILVALLPLGGDDDDDDGKGDTGAAAVASDNEGGGGEDKPGVTEDTLIAIDQALTSKNEDDALDLIRPARDKYPEDPQLLWREGKALAMKRARSRRITALERYGEALERDPSLIDDPDFYGELYVLLRQRALQEQAINLALQKLGEGGHKFLLELVNVDDSKKMLDWVERHRVLTELRSSPESMKLVDWKLNLARDLYQAKDAPEPCAAFRDTLDGIAKSGDVYFVEHVFNDRLKPPEAGDDPEDAEICPTLEGKLVALRSQLAKAHPEETAKYGDVGKKQGKKKKKKKGLFGG